MKPDNKATFHPPRTVDMPTLVSDVTRCVLYARFSTDLQRSASIEDQQRALREALPRLDMIEAAAFADAAVSGSTMERPGLMGALDAIESGRADVLFAEALDRISRDLEHVAQVAKRVAFAGGRIVTLAEGEITALHIGLSGTMAQVYLEELARKTKRGLRGVIEEGRIPAGRAYGYRPTMDRGRFEIVPEEAAVVVRIFEEYAKGVSPRRIAHQLNAERIPGPRGGEWKANTIVGERAAQTGIINNPLYIGRLVWNRSEWKKDPRTGRRRCFERPPGEWVVKPVAHLRIVPEELWEAVKAAQGEFVRRGGVRRPTRPLSGLLVCADCGSALTIVARDRYGCPKHKEAGTCPNGRSVAAAAVEKRVLDGLRSQLCHREVLDEFARTYVEEMKRLRKEQDVREGRVRQELGVARREHERALTAYIDADREFRSAVSGRLREAIRRVEELEAELAKVATTETVVDIGRVDPGYLTRNLDRLWNGVTSDPDVAAEARAALASLVARIVVRFGDRKGEFTMEIEGDLGTLLAMATAGITQPGVAGVGFEPTTFRL